MSDIQNLMMGLNIDPEKLASFATKVKTNPMAAVAAFGELGLSMDFFGKLAEIIRANPTALAEYAKSLGIEDGTIESAKKQAESLFQH